MHFSEVLDCGYWDKTYWILIYLKRIHHENIEICEEKKKQVKKSQYVWTLNTQIVQRHGIPLAMVFLSKSEMFTYELQTNGYIMSDPINLDWADCFYANDKALETITFLVVWEINSSKM